MSGRHLGINHKAHGFLKVYFGKHFNLSNASEEAVRELLRVYSQESGLGTTGKILILTYLQIEDFTPKTGVVNKYYSKTIFKHGELQLYRFRQMGLSPAIDSPDIIIPNSIKATIYYNDYYLNYHGDYLWEVLMIGLPPDIIKEGVVPMIEETREAAKKVSLTVEEL